MILLQTNAGEGGKGKKSRTVSDDSGGKSLSDTSTSADVKSTVIHTSVNIFQASKRDKSQYFVDKVKDKRRLSGSEHMIREFNNSGRKITSEKRQRHLKSRLSGDKVQPRRMPRGTTLTR